MRKGDTILFETPPRVAGYGSVGGRREARGPLAKEFDTLITETQCGEKTWEKAESTFARTALETALRRAGVSAADLCAVFAGDLQCQCTASAYLMRDVDAPYLGLYGACSTMAEGLGLAACMVAGGMMHMAAALSSSHFCAAERQFRTPLDYGGKRTPTAQWTVTGAGAVVLSGRGSWHSFWKRKAWCCTTIRIAACWCSTAKRRTCRRAARAQGARPVCCAAMCCPGWKWASCGACCSSPPAR